MFSTLGVLRKGGVVCPDPLCKRVSCIFSHQEVQRPASSSAPRAADGQAPAKRARLEPAASTSSSRKQASDPSAKPRAPGPPVLRDIYGSHSPLPLRNEILKLLYNAFFDLYVNLPSRRDLAYEHASEQERFIYKATKAHSYKTVAAQNLAKVKRRDKPKLRSDASVGTNEEVDARASRQSAEATKANAPDLTGGLTAKAVQPYTLARAPAIAVKEYVTDVPSSTGGTKPTEEGKSRTCDRCKKTFVVTAVLSETERTACQYHWGRVRNERGGGPGVRRTYACCGSMAPCSIGAHVFRDSDVDVLHARSPFVSTSSLGAAAAASDVVALDGEFVYTTAGLSLARLTAVVPGSREAALDELIRPPGAVLDCNTRFSGITSPEELLSKAVLDLAGLQQALGAFIGPQTVLVGHGLENDLRALRLVHPLSRIVDTAILYPHPAGFPIRHSLRNLVKSYLGTFIQDEGTHDSAVDARSALELLALKVASGGAEPKKLA